MKKKILAGVLASVVAVATAVSVSAVTEDIVVDGSSEWNSAGSGVTFPITEAGVTVTFENEPFIRDNDNWSNFVFETLATDDAAGITLRADAYGWTYGDNEDNVPEYTESHSWGDDWEGAFHEAAPGTVKLTATKTSSSVVTFNIVFENGATLDYTVTYPAGVPDGLEFQVGADGGKITLLADAGSFDNSGNNSGDDDDDDNDTDNTDNSSDDTGNTDNSGNGTGDTNTNTNDKQNADTGIEGVAIAAGLAIIAAGAVVVAKKRK